MDTGGLEKGEGVEIIVLKAVTKKKTKTRRKKMKKKKKKMKKMMGLKMGKRKRQKKNKKKQKLKKKKSRYLEVIRIFYCNDVMYFLFVYRYLSVSMLF